MCNKFITKILFFLTLISQSVSIVWADQLVYAQRKNYDIAVYNASQQTYLGDIGFPGAPYSSLGFSPDGTMAYALVLGLPNGFVVPIDVTNNTLEGSIIRMPDGLVSELKVSTDGKELYIASDTGLFIVDLSTRLTTTIAWPTRDGMEVADIGEQLLMHDTMLYVVSEQVIMAFDTETKTFTDNIVLDQATSYNRLGSSATMITPDGDYIFYISANTDGEIPSLVKVSLVKRSVEAALSVQLLQYTTAVGLGVSKTGDSLYLLASTAFQTTNMVLTKYDATTLSEITAQVIQSDRPLFGFNLQIDPISEQIFVLYMDANLSVTKEVELNGEIVSLPVTTTYIEIYQPDLTKLTDLGYASEDNDEIFSGKLNVADVCSDCAQKSEPVEATVIPEPVTNTGPVTQPLETTEPTLVETTTTTETGGAAGGGCTLNTAAGFDFTLPLLLLLALFQIVKQPRSAGENNAI